MANWIKETVDLMSQRKAGKRELRRLPKDELARAYNDGWLDHFWSLPKSKQAAAIDLRLEGLRLRKRREERDADLDALTKSHRDRERRFWLPYGYRPAPPEEPDPPSRPLSPPEPPTEEEIRELQRIAEKLRSEKAPDPIRMTGKFREAMEKIEQAESLIKGTHRRLGEPWDAWIAALPDEAREEGTLACLLWRDMIGLRNRLHEAIQERRVLAGILEDEAQRVLDVRMFELRGKIKACEKGFSTLAPFFERYGKPPLVEKPEVPTRRS